MKTGPIFAALMVSTVAVAAFAHSGATGIVKERMDAMDAMGDAVKTVAPMMQGEVPYDAGAVRAAAETFRMHSGEAMTELFPEGSGGAPSEAKAEIWSEWEEFSALAEQLALYAEGLSGAADNGLMASGGTGIGAGSMMGGGGMMGTGGDMMGGVGGGMMSAEDIAEMPAAAAFAMVGQVCSACHTKFRAGDD